MRSFLTALQHNVGYLVPYHYKWKRSTIFRVSVSKKTRMRGKAQPDGRPAVELIETLVRLSLIPTRATPLFD